MILVSRDGSYPDETWLRLAERERDRARDYYSAKSRGGRFDFETDTDQIFELLMEVFAERCAFCEQSTWNVHLGGHVCRFRPRHAVMGLDGTTLEPGYWWLAMDWSNLLLTCPDCAANQATRFPLVDEAERARTPDDDLAAERPLLLDPCATDEWEDPDHYLLFSEDGLVASSYGSAWQEPTEGLQPPGRGEESFDEFRWRRFGEIDPAQVTIDALGLNRKELVELRAEAARETQGVVEPDDAPEHLVELDELDDWFAEFVDEAREFVALQRQLLRQMAWDVYNARAAATDRTVQWDFTGRSAEAFSKIKAPENIDRVLFEQRSYQETLEGSSVEDDSTYHFGRSSRVQRVRLVNFRCFEELDFSFSGGGERAGWKMLLGENGVGKSTVLQAVALVLMGQNNFERLVSQGDLDPSALRRREADPDAEASVEVWMGADNEPRRMTLLPDGLIEFSSGATKGSRTVLLGFGSARWLFRPGGHDPDDDPNTRVRNLFNPFVPLGDTVAWLLDLDDNDFDDAEAPLLGLLGLIEEGRRLDRTEIPGDVRVAVEGSPPEHWDRLRDLSDGYQTVLAMSGDIIELLTRQFNGTVSAEGLVLIDEIGAHLHPRWRMRVVSRLREAFPQVQFLATTHEPLCLRGLDDGEIMVMRRGDAGVIETLDDLPAVDDLRVDQLLTSNLFGLSTTLDPAMEDRMNRYYDLLAQRDDLDGDEEDELVALKQEVGGKGVLGNNERDRLIYEAVDEFIAHQRAEPDADISELRDETKREVAELWAEISGGRDG